jgi:hypothetical protein
MDGDDQRSSEMAALPHKPSARKFAIDLENRLQLYASKHQGSAAPGLAKFASERELLVWSASWPGTRLVEIWNNLPGTKLVRRFTSRKTAVRRIWGAIVGLRAQDGPLEQLSPQSWC